MFRVLPRRSLLMLLSVLLAALTAHSQQVNAQRQGDDLRLWNEVISATWSLRDGTLRGGSLTNELAASGVPMANDVFELVPREGAVLRSTDFNVIGAAVIEDIPVAATSSRQADHIPGRQIRIELENSSANVRVTWKAILREHANYIRQEVTIHAGTRSVPLTRIELVNVTASGAEVTGHVKGSPVDAPGWFFGVEHPLSECRARQGRATCWLERELPVRAGQSVTYSSVYGATHLDQPRRDFLAYLELERAHPYRTFLHYNTWYDLGYFNRFDERDVVKEVQAFGEQLTTRRGVKLDSFLLDDGWDDPQTLWHFNSGFPDGLTNVSKAAAQLGAAPGIWFSPWGGYDKPKEQRLASARMLGFETNEGGLALSGPKYYRYFRDACFAMIDKYGVNQFKFDGTGNANEVIKGSEFDSDFDAAIHLIGELRAKKPDIYINLTTGTYPSPFWLLYADSIWRGGEDHTFAGVGSNRQRWITYRDSDVYRHVVEEGPLFPLSSLMLHGLIYARYAERLGVDPNHDFRDEVHDYFGTGTQLQEMYITPSLLSPQDWDALAEAAKWSRANAQTLKDTHWIGGDPALLEVYGWAAWSPEKAILTLRNPSEHARDFTASVARLLELPQGTATQFTAHSPWKSDADTPAETLKVGEAHTFHLGPFQVLTLELTPAR